MTVSHLSVALIPIVAAVWLSHATSPDSAFCFVPPLCSFLNAVEGTRRESKCVAPDRCVSRCKGKNFHGRSQYPRMRISPSARSLALHPFAYRRFACKRRATRLCHHFCHASPHDHATLPPSCSCHSHHAPSHSAFAPVVPPPPVVLHAPSRPSRVRPCACRSRRRRFLFLLFLFLWE